MLVSSWGYGGLEEHFLLRSLDLMRTKMCTMTRKKNLNVRPKSQIIMTRHNPQDLTGNGRVMGVPVRIKATGITQQQAKVYIPITIHLLGHITTI